MRKTLLLASVALAGVPMALFHTDSIAAQPAPSSPAQGALQDPFSGRAQDLPPALRILQGNNVKITALGEHGARRGAQARQAIHRVGCAQRGRGHGQCGHVAGAARSKLRCSYFLKATSRTS